MREFTFEGYNSEKGSWKYWVDCIHFLLGVVNTTNLAHVSTAYIITYFRGRSSTDDGGEY